MDKTRLSINEADRLVWEAQTSLSERKAELRNLGTELRTLPQERPDVLERRPPATPRQTSLIYSLIEHPNSFNTCCSHCGSSLSIADRW